MVPDPETAPLAPVAHSTEVNPQSNFGYTDDDEERDSGVDDDSDFEEEFVDRLIQKYL